MDDKTVTPPPGEKSLDESTPVEVNGTPEIELLPGTRLLVDIQHKVHAAHDADKEIVLIPQPSSDPDDPLNWGPVRKYVAFGIMCFYCMMLGAATISPGITYGALIMEFGATVNYLNTGAALSLLFLGAGNLLLNPLVRISKPKHFQTSKLTHKGSQIRPKTRLPFLRPPSLRLPDRRRRSKKQSHCSRGSHPPRFRRLPLRTVARHLRRRPILHPPPRLRDLPLCHLPHFRVVPWTPRGGVCD